MDIQRKCICLTMSPISRRVGPQTLLPIASLDTSAHMSASGSGIAPMFGGSSTAAKGKGPATGDEPAAYELPWRVLSTLFATARADMTFSPTGSRRYNSSRIDNDSLRVCPVPVLTAPYKQHRPRTLDDIVGNVETIERLKVIARDGNCPHIIISVRLTGVCCRASRCHRSRPLTSIPLGLRVHLVLARLPAS
jgi:hypothetical protein